MGVTRRQFLEATGTFAVAVLATPLGFRAVAAREAKAEAFRPNVWVAVTPDDRVIATVNKCEMGQGVFTSLPMILADELGGDWQRVRIWKVPAGQAYIDPVWGMEATGGSTSVRHMFEPLRTAAAAAREVLIQAAAQEWGVLPSECAAHDGVVVHGASARSLRFGQLVDRAAGLPVPEKPKLKKDTELTLIGKPVKRLDLPKKVQGKARFGIDSEADGMLYAAVARQPAYGAKPDSYDEKAALAVPGVKKVVALRGGSLGICGDGIYAAWQGRDKLNIKWSPGSTPDLDTAAVEKALRDELSKEGVLVKKTGDPDRALAGAAKVVEATYLLPYLAHATMEPMNCTVDVRKDRCDIWTPSQNQTGTLGLAQKMTGLKPHQIRVHTTYLGCGLGRRFETDFLEEAIELSQRTGKPVKLIWDRDEDSQHDFYRPGNACHIRAGLDEGRKPVVWAHEIACPSIWARVNPKQMKGGVDPAAVEGVEDTPYRFPNFLVRYARVDLPVPVGFWRSVGNSENAFTMESFMDEVAHAAGADPLEFRLALLPKDSRSYRVLEVVAEKAGWAKGPQQGQALGIAQHVSFGSTAAHVAEVSVDKGSGRVKVHRVVAAIDCGRVVNPDIVEAQVMGAVVMGLSAALKEKVEFAKGGVSSANFDSYEILRTTEAPEVEVHTVATGGPLGGIGEPGLPPTAPAVANAVFAATGARLRSLPMTPQVVREALQGT